MTVSNSYKKIIERCWQLRKERRLAEAELLLHEELEKYASDSFAYRLLKANLADLLLQRSDNAAARNTALEVLADDPDQVVALTVLGLVALNKKEYAEAVENLKKAYALFPGGYRAGRLARAYELNNEAEKAVDVLNDALLKNPRDGYLLRQLNSIREKTAEGEGTAGINKEQPLPSVSGVDEDEYFPYAEQMRVRLNKFLPAEAVEQLQKVLKIGGRKSNPYLWLLFGDLQRKAGDAEAALEAYHEARTLDPQNPLALSHYVYALRRLRRLDEAWPLLKELLLSRPLDVTAKSSLLKDAGDLNREEEAALFFEELLQKYPERKEYYGAIRKLREASAGKGGA